VKERLNETVIMPEYRWHKWPDEKPPEEGQYLVYSPPGSEEAGFAAAYYWKYMSSGGGTFSNGYDWDDEFVTHWRPLPAPPEE
jgi:hypothetical protein